MGSPMILVTRALLCSFLPLGAAGDYLISFHTEVESKCEPIQIEACKAMGYNETSMPNLVGIESQIEAEYRLNSFRPAIEYGCSSQLQFLLCSLYSPMCVPELPVPIGPCRPLCETVRQLCAPLLAQFGYAWPPALNCSRLPQENKEDVMCMEGPGEVGTHPSVVKVTLRPPPTPPVSKCVEYAHWHQYRYINATQQCAPVCYAHISFTSEDKLFAGVWMAIWSVVCFALTLFTVFSFLLEASAFKYPERAAVHMALCYNLVAVGYLIRLAAGVENVTCHIDAEIGEYVTVTEGALHTPCVIVFLFLYYFSNAAAVWWVMLCISWLMRVWRNMAHEQVLRHSSCFHIAAWGIPAAQTILCIVLRKLDSDELTGTCYAGQQNTETLVRFVLVPQFLCLVVGATLVLIVFACLWKKRSRLQSEGLKTDRVVVMAARVGMAAVLYMVPVTCLVGTTFYEYVERDRWLKDSSVRPNIEVFMLKIFMSLAAGIMAGLFLANSQVFASWRRLWLRFSSSKQPLPPYLQAPHLNPVVANHSLKGALPHGTEAHFGPVCVHPVHPAQQSKSHCAKTHHCKPSSETIV